MEENVANNYKGVENMNSDIVKTSKSIATVVVTYNRKKLLMQCLNSLANQTFKPATVYIVDNASTDGTKDLLIQDGRYYNKEVNGIRFVYVGLKENSGGAGGFYYGMKTAFECNEQYDAIWVMDDDGLPDKDCLANLAPWLSRFDYIAPMVLAKEDTSILAFNYNGCYNVNDILRHGQMVEDYACPMNAILFSRKLIEKIGFPIPNMFIWGDEVNFTLRAKDAGFTPVTITKAIHIHPKDRIQFAKTLLGHRIVVAPSYWREYCMIRNMIFNFKDRRKFHGIGLIKEILLYHLPYYIFQKKDIKATICCIEAMLSGFKKNPDQGYKKWMKVK